MSVVNTYNVDLCAVPETVNLDVEGGLDKLGLGVAR